MPTIRPSAKTSILAPTRWGVEPVRRDNRHERGCFAPLERVGHGGEDFLVHQSDYTGPAGGGACPAIAYPGRLFACYRGELFLRVRDGLRG